LNLFPSSNSKYLTLLILCVAAFASGQDRKLSGGYNSDLTVGHATIT